MNTALDKFFNKMTALGIALTYGDVRLKTGYSEVVPYETSIATRFSRNIPLNMPVVSAAMDTVTEAMMAIALAKHGGLGILHKNLSPKEQARQVDRVKLHLNGLIVSPICVKSDDTIHEVLAMRDKQGFTFHSFPVVESGRLVGLLTRNDFDFAPDKNCSVHEVMTPREKLSTAPACTTIEQAYEQMRSQKKKLLPLINDREGVVGLYVFSDLVRIRSGQSTHNVDSAGHLRIGAAVGIGEGALERAALLASKGCDVFVVGTAHGDSKNVHDAVKALKRLYPHIDVVAGNVSRGEAAKRLADIGADGILVGQGPGSICTTRVIAGIGCPQVTAVYECAKALRGTDIPVCADGGIENSGDIVVALGVGAESVILGRMLAGTEEAPGNTRMINGTKVKEYRGMGSLGAMQDNMESRNHYRQTEKFVPEGVESIVPFIGSAHDVLDQYLGGVRSGMGYVGARTIAELAKNAELIRITASGLAESHPHGVTIIKDAPNYRSTR